MTPYRKSASTKARRVRLPRRALHVARWLTRGVAYAVAWGAVVAVGSAAYDLGRAWLADADARAQRYHTACETACLAYGPDSRVIEASDPECSCATPQGVVAHYAWRRVGTMP